MSLSTLLVLTLLQSPAEATTPPEAPKAPAGVLQPPTWVPHDSPEGQLWLEGTSKVLAEHLSSLDRRRLGTKVLSPSRVGLTKGKFPHHGDVLVTVNVELRVSEPDAAPQTITGMFTLTREGALASMIIEPKMRGARYEIRAIGHHDDDGQHDFEYDETSLTTVTQHRVTWAEGQPHDEILGTKPTPTPPAPAE